jgi:uncharacterized protein (TIGR00255 family)
MTGFGVGEAPLGRGKVVVEVRAVNHRHLDVRTRLPRELSDAGMFVEQLVRARLSRGRCEVGVRFEGPVLASVTLDLARARAAFEGFSKLRDELAPGADVPLSLLGAVPDLFVQSDDGELGRVRSGVERALGTALDGMDAMRCREGAAIARDLVVRVRAVAAIIDGIARRLPEVVSFHRKRLADRVRTIACGLDGPIDAGRLEQEVIFFADRTDVSEELTRLAIHFAGVEDLLASPEPSGRRLDFLLQEVGGEINTIGAKSQDASVARAIVDAKSELERLREQVQNVE